MDKPISVGDLVMVVRDDCCDCGLGAVFRVDVIALKHGITICTDCGASSECPPMKASGGERKNWPLPWLKRIPPLDELEGERTDEKFKEPA